MIANVKVQACDRTGRTMLPSFFGEEKGGGGGVMRTHLSGGLKGSNEG